MSKQEPVAWAVVSDSKEEIDCEFIYPDATTAGDVALDINGGVVPLYRHPRTTLTAAEREAIDEAIKAFDEFAGDEVYVTALRRLLKRHGVKMTDQWKLAGNDENVDWTDLAVSGRAYADNLVGEPAVSKIMHSMADEIELLRGYRDEAESDAAIAHLLVEKLRLGTAERKAIEDCIKDDEAATHYERADTLRKLLERLK